MEWQKKRQEYEGVKARAKELEALKHCTVCGTGGTKLCQGCGTTAYCSTACQRIDWRERGHRQACKKIQEKRAAGKAQAEAPTPARDVFYGPAPRSGADEVRARIAAEHEAARARREAEPEPEPESARFGSHCPICCEDWDLIDRDFVIRMCCCRKICESCHDKVFEKPCPLCRTPWPKGGESLASLRRHVENGTPEAMTELAKVYFNGHLGLAKSAKKAAKWWKRAADLGEVDAMRQLVSMLDPKLRAYSGVKQDEKKAMQMIRMAMDRGSPKAHLELGMYFFRRDQFDEGTDAMKLAAEKGCVEAEAYIGMICASGWRHVGPHAEIDIEEGKRWLRRAAAKGHKQAIANLEQLNRPDAFEQLSRKARARAERGE